MKLLSLDLETTGLDPQTCQILEIGAVLFDTSKPDVPVEQLPTFHQIVRHDPIIGQPYALQMNADLLQQISDGQGVDISKALRAFAVWLVRDVGLGKTDKITITGKNVASFDLPFLREAERNSWQGSYNAFEPIVTRFFSHRTLDPGTLFFDPSIDEKIPNSKLCMERAGISGEVAHTAVEDAQSVIHMLQSHYFSVVVSE